MEALLGFGKVGGETEEEILCGIVYILFFQEYMSF